MTRAAKRGAAANKIAKKVKVSWENQAEASFGFDESTQRAARENCNQLKFKNCVFDDVRGVIMSEPCEIYVRHSGGGTLLHAYGDPSVLASPNEGGGPLAFVELSILPEWITDAAKRSAYKESGELIHVRIPIHSASGFR